MGIGNLTLSSNSSYNYRVLTFPSLLRRRATSTDLLSLLVYLADGS